jgi:hypothetical protein
MNYVEWLRVRRVLRNTAIVLALVILAGIGLRIYISPYMTTDKWIHHFEKEPSTKVTQSVLADGAKRTVIDSPSDQTRIVIDDRGYKGRHIQVTEPTKNAHEHNDNVSFGSFNVTESRHGALTVTDIDTNNSVPLIFYMIFADIVALVIATVLGAPFARENDGHLEYALTKPASRARLAVGIMAADWIGISAASFMTVLALYICQLFFGSASIDFSGINLQALAIGIAVPLTWYAMLCAATASMSRGYAAVLGFAWPVAMLVIVLGIAPLGNSLVAEAVRSIFHLLTYINPLAYVSFAVGTDSHDTLSTAQASFASRISIELALFALYSIAAVLQWRRVEA